MTPPSSSGATTSVWPALERHLASVAKPARFMPRTTSAADGRRPVSSLEKASSPLTWISKAPVATIWAATLFAIQTAPKAIILFSATEWYQPGVAAPKSWKTFSPPRSSATQATWAMPAACAANTPTAGGGYCSAATDRRPGYASSRNFLSSR